MYVWVCVCMYGCLHAWMRAWLCVHLSRFLSLCLGGIRRNGEICGWSKQDNALTFPQRHDVQAPHLQPSTSHISNTCPVRVRIAYPLIVVRILCAKPMIITLTSRPQLSLHQRLLAVITTCGGIYIRGYESGSGGTADLWYLMSHMQMLRPSVVIPLVCLKYRVNILFFFLFRLFISNCGIVFVSDRKTCLKYP